MFEFIFGKSVSLEQLLKSLDLEDRRKIDRREIDRTTHILEQFCKTTKNIFKESTYTYNPKEYRYLNEDEDDKYWEKMGK